MYVCMVHLRWGFEKTYDFVFSKKPDLDLNKGFIQQMFALDMKMLAARQRKSPNLSNGTAKPVRKNNHIYTYIDTYIHTSYTHIHTYITYIHTYIHTYVHTLD